MLSILQCVKKIQTIYLKTCLCRSYMKISEKMELMYKQSDKVSKSCKLIYRHPQVPMVSFIYHSMNFLTFMSVSHITYLYYKGLLSEVIETSFELGGIFTFVGLVFILSQKLRSGLPMRIYYNDQDKNNKAIFLGKIPFTSEHYEFPINSVTYANKDLFLWSNAAFQSKNRRIFLIEENFKTYNDFYKMLRTDKN